MTDFFHSDVGLGIRPNPRIYVYPRTYLRLGKIGERSTFKFSSPSWLIYSLDPSPCVRRKRTYTRSTELSCHAPSISSTWMTGATSPKFVVTSTSLNSLSRERNTGFLGTKPIRRNWQGMGIYSSCGMSWLRRCRVDEVCNISPGNRILVLLICRHNTQPPQRQRNISST